MKVLHFLNTSSFSGAENVVISIINGIKRYGCKDNVVESVYVSIDGKIREVLESYNICFEPVSKLSLSEVRRVLKKHQPDVIHAHDFTASIICSATAGNIPVISHLHNNPPWIKKLCLNSLVFAISCLKYKKILGVSEAVFKEYIFENMVKRKTKVVGNPIDISNVVNLAESAEDKGKYDLVFLGRLAEQKDPLRFIEIVKMLIKEKKDISAVMIGDGDLKKQVLEKVKEYGLEGIVTLKGFMKNPYGILSNSKILCMPSKWEGFGLVAVEALSLGKPVLTTGVGGLGSIVNDSCGKLCKNDNDFVEEIVNLIDNEEYYNEMTKGAQKRAQELNNIEMYIKEIEKNYFNSHK